MLIRSGRLKSHNLKSDTSYIHNGSFTCSFFVFTECNETKHFIEVKCTSLLELTLWTTIDLDYKQCLMFTNILIQLIYASNAFWILVKSSYILLHYLHCLDDIRWTMIYVERTYVINLFFVAITVFGWSSSSLSQESWWISNLSSHNIYYYYHCHHYC